MTELRTPAEWCEITGAKIVDPDGWRGPRPNPKSFDQPISRAEFDERLRSSTVDLGDMIGGASAEPRCRGCYDSFSGWWCDNCDQWPCVCVPDGDED